MKPKKLILLFLALLFPACIFVFLKFFGKNEFSVQPLFSDVYPENVGQCGDSISLPYQIHDSVRTMLNSNNSLLTLVAFDELETDVTNRLTKTLKEYGPEINVLYSISSPDNMKLQHCVFFMQEPLDLALVDDNGAIRGLYDASDREEVDRLIMEIAIILKRY